MGLEELILTDVSYAATSMDFDALWRSLIGQILRAFLFPYIYSRFFRPLFFLLFSPLI